MDRVRMALLAVAMCFASLLFAPHAAARVHKAAKSRGNELDMCEVVQPDYNALQRECDVDVLLKEVVNKDNELYECFSKPGLSHAVGESFFVPCSLGGGEPEPWQFMCFECGAELVYRPETAAEKQQAKKGLMFKF